MSTRELDKSDVVAGILVGGSGRRIGGAKHLLAHPEGGTLVEHVAGVASEVCAETVLLGDAKSLPRSVAALPALADDPPGRGPLGGLAALLRYAGAGRWGVLCACDLPLLEPALLRRMLRAATERCEAVAFCGPGGRKQWHACCALYRAETWPAVRRELGRSGRLQALLAALRVVTIRPNAEQERALTSVNTREEYQAVVGA